MTNAAKSNLLSGSRLERCRRWYECAKADGNAQFYPFIVIGPETAVRQERDSFDPPRRLISECSNSKVKPGLAKWPNARTTGRSASLHSDARMSHWARVLV